MTWQEKIDTTLSERRASSLYRQRRVVEGPQAAEMSIDGQTLLSFCSNDYLGLANHPDLIRALKKGADAYGAGSGAAHLINGHSYEHHALEEELAAFVGRPRALLFSTGYMANLGVVSALAGRGDTVLQDRLNHASLLDAGLLSQARFQRYPHADIDALHERLQKASGDTLVVTDGVFSMDGDIAPLPELATATHIEGGWLMVDDAHGLGVLGETGAGSIEHFGLGLEEVPILMGTLGKAFGSFGAFVAGSDALIEFLINEARSYIYTTAMPAAQAAASRAALKRVQEDGWRRERLLQLIQRFRQGAEQLGLPLMASTTPIQPLLVGESEQAVSISESLVAQGILVTAIRPPTVPVGSARLRITFSASHSDEHVDRLLEGLQQSWQDVAR